MEYDAFLQKCNEDDVLELENQMVKLSKFSSNLDLALKWNTNSDALLAVAKFMKTPPLSNPNVKQLFDGDGVDANILRIGSQGWKKGKIKLKLTLEFYPDEPEETTSIDDAEINQTSSPLDDIRQMMNKDN